MPDDDLLPPAPADPTPTPVREDPGTLRCQFCKSSLTARGEVLRLSDTAKKLRDFEDDVDDLRRELVTAQAEIENQRSIAESWKAEAAKLQKALTEKSAKFAI